MLRSDEQLQYYFPDPCIEKDPPHHYFFSVISSVRPDILQNLMQQAEQRHCDMEESNQNLFHVSQRIMGELNTVNFRYSMLKKRGDKRIYQGSNKNNNEEWN